MTIKTLLTQVEAEAELTQDRINELETKIAQLTALGCWKGKEYWTGKDKKYLYVLKPMTNGKRKKVYVGSQEYKIEEARAKMARWHEREHLVDQLRKFESRHFMIENALEEILKKTNWLYGAVSNSKVDFDNI